jgi:hypothetical protein
LIVGYVLLWVEGMAFALLCLALAARWAASGRWALRAAVPAVVWFLFAALGAFAMHATAAWQSDYGRHLSSGPFGFFLSWLLVYLAASLLLLRRGFRRPAPGLARTGAGWPRKQLWLSLGGTVLALGLTFWNLDVAARADLSVARQEAGDLLQTMSPPPVAESANAARLVVEAARELTEPIRNPWRDAAWESQPADAGRAVNWKDSYVVGLVAKHEKALALARQAAALPPSDLTGRRSLDDPGAWVDNELWETLRKQWTLLAVDARVQAAHGNTQRAFEDVAAILGFTRHWQGFLSGPATLGGQFRTWRTLEDVLRLARATKASLPAVAFPETISPLRTLHREMAVMGMICPAMLSGDPLRLMTANDRSGELARWSKPPRVYLTDTLLVPGCRILLTPAELAYSRKKWEEYRRVLRVPPEGTPQDWSALRRLVEEEPTGGFSALYVKPREQKLLHDGGQLAALEQMARAGLAAARYRDKHGKYPERLEQLVPAFLPAMPVDPRDGRGLRLKHFPEVVVLYTLADSAALEAERSWEPQKHAGAPIFRLPPR